VWRTREELFAILQQYRLWHARGGDRLVSQLIRLTYVQPRQAFYAARRRPRVLQSPTTPSRKPG
jgi:hypothetical protein